MSIVRSLRPVSLSPGADCAIDAGKEFPYRLGMITSKLTSKAQTTIPQPVRTALRLREGDELAYQIEGNRVILTRASQSGVADDPFLTFEEWDSEADRKAYGKL